ncbi:MAG: DMT family transporter [Pseudomonadota bacterium]
MERKSRLDAIGITAMLGFALLFAFNQVVIKVTIVGISPIFAAALRSVLGLGALWLWIRYRGISLKVTRGQFWGGCLIGALFTTEFIFLFLALDLTTVGRASVIFYTMPVWLGLVAHFVLPGETLSGVRLLGFLIAISGIALAFWDGATGEANLLGDLLALLAALFWAAIALAVRLTPVSEAEAEVQLFFQLAMSGATYLVIAPLFGPLIRDIAPIHVAAIGFQSIILVLFGFLVWFRLMKIYPASDIAAFSFLSPVLSVVLGWWLLGEELGAEIIAALGLVCIGLVLISRRPNKA